MHRSIFYFADYGVSSDIKVFHQLTDLLPLAKELAKVPISRFNVGAIALGESGNAYLGCNVEFEGLPLNFTIHAEQSAVVNARSNGEKNIVALIVSEPPCGYCRQFLSELGNNTLQISVGDNTFTLADLLPNAFRLKGEDNNLLTLSAEMEKGNLVKDPLEKALCMAKASYSPYTKTQSGISIVCDSGEIYGGCIIESGAYNPTLSAFQTAIIAQTLSGDKSDIKEVFLCERGETPLYPMINPLIKSVAPSATVTVTIF